MTLNDVIKTTNTSKDIIKSFKNASKKFMEKE